MINKLDISQDILSLGNKIGHKPSYREYVKNGSYSAQSVINHFATWNNAIDKCIGKNLPSKPTRKKREKKCEVCGKPTTNWKYCSHSCSAKRTNKSHYKPEIHRFCKCGKEIYKQSSVCRKCYMMDNIKEYGKKTLGHFRQTGASKNRYQPIRNHAHQIAEYFKLKPTKCHLCNYENHLDLCHIRDIGSFSDETKLEVINDLDNLVFLCPNHHWDLGHGKIDKNSIKWSTRGDLNP